MVLYPTDRKLLSVMKKAQERENRFVILLDDLTCCGSDGFEYETAQKALANEPRIRIPLDSSSYSPALDSLISKGLVRRNGSSPAHQVTHDGWCNRYLNMFESAKMILTHFLFPCAVAFVTTLVTLFLLG